jgi:hypothetical protein
MSFKTATPHYFRTAECWQTRLRYLGSIDEGYLCGRAVEYWQQVAALHAQQY